MARSFLKLYSLDLGFETGHLLTLRTQLVESKYPKPEQRQIFFDALLARLRALPGVTHAAMASTLPLGGTGGVQVRDRRAAGRATRPTRPRVSVVDAGPGYFETLGVTDPAWTRVPRGGRRTRGGGDRHQPAARDGAPGQRGSDGPAHPPHAGTERRSTRTVVDDRRREPDDPSGRSAGARAGGRRLSPLAHELVAWARPCWCAPRPIPRR